MPDTTKRIRGRPPDTGPPGLLLHVPSCADIIEARRRAGHSQTEAAHAVGMSRWATWSDWERGRKPMPALAWSFYALATGQHAQARLCQRGAADCDKASAAGSLAPDCVKVKWAIVSNP